MATWLVDAGAECDDCGAEFLARNAQGLAAQHAKRYGHRTHGFLAYAFEFPDSRDEAGASGDGPDET